MNDDQIKHMTERFLQWRLPDNFGPDGGVSFKPSYDEEPFRSRHWPVGTNLLDYTQANAMMRHVVEGLPEAQPQSLSLNEYQRLAQGTATYPGQGSFRGMAYVVSKLTGEAGEVAENFGKAIRDDGFGSGLSIGEGTPGVSENMDIVIVPMTEERSLKMKKELGDVLWYVAACAKELGYTLEEIAAANIEKLYDRKERGVLNGDGDDR